MAKNTKKGKNGAKESTKPEKKNKVLDTSEIDDIFNTKKITSTTSSTTTEQAAKKRKADNDILSRPKKITKEAKTEEEEQDNKKVEEVVFAELAAVKSEKKTQKKPVVPPSDDDFGDSRGLKKPTRTTEEGYPLYDIKDLNIGLGKDTPECPFDCQCCKYIIYYTTTC
ncbi:hypothetical protein BCV72DRAFT_300830 [Rhizopus microsporus var. microsporus]|uniref:DUF1764-domain-containing protein n=1 Tax=Rhizopus microsporus var. microsporus TaxID=86635 RepID=A0A1X0RHQ8_RHIZD|nr:hypothetical protein BCV72DRAFT_300830 [Rhizopus microsporus var. microsporus]